MARRRGKQSDAEGFGCLLLIVVVGVIYLFDAHPWLWDVLKVVLALVVLGVVIKIVTAVVRPIANAWQRHKAAREEQRLLEEAQRQDRIRAKMIAWKEQQNLEAKRKKLEEARRSPIRSSPEFPDDSSRIHRGLFLFTELQADSTMR